MKNTEAIILSAGKGTRMNSLLPKVLLQIGGKSILHWIIELLKSCNFDSGNFVLGHKSEIVINALQELDFKSRIIIQTKLDGTAKALEQGLKTIKPNTKNILVLFGDDAGLYNSKSIKDLIKYHVSNENIATFMILKDNRVSDIGGLEVNQNNEVVGVKTMSEIKNNPKLEYYVLCGAFCFNSEWIKSNIGKIKVNPLSREYPLPQIIEVAKNQNLKVKGYLLKDSLEWESINTLEGLKIADEKKYKQINK